MANRIAVTTAVSLEVNASLIEVARSLGKTASAYVRGLIEHDLAERGQAAPSQPSGRRLSVNFQFGPEASDFLRAKASEAGLDRNAMARRYAVAGMRADGLVDDPAADALAKAEAGNADEWEDEL